MAFANLPHEQNKNQHVVTSYDPMDRVSDFTLNPPYFK
jgi:hypothetical protein